VPSALSISSDSFSAAIGRPAMSMLQPCIIIPNQDPAPQIICELMTAMGAISGILGHDPAHKHAATWSLEQAKWHPFIHARPHDMRNMPMSGCELGCPCLTIVDSNARYLNHN